jgi:alpha-tubulin suppressor-like RCC1 family protein
VKDGLDYVTLYNGSNIYSVNAYASPFNISLQKAWTGSEFNVFGLYSAYPVAMINVGSTLTVKTTIINGTQNQPSCSTGFSGTTFESNSLSLMIGTCLPSGGTAPSITFVESNGSATNYTIGGTVSGLTGPVSLSLLSTSLFSNSQVQNLMPSADGGFTFTTPVQSGSDWSVGAGGTGQNCTVTNGSGTNLSADVKNVIVKCAADPHTVTATSDGNGNITPASQTVNYNEQASFTVIPNAGFRVASVTGNPCIVIQSGQSDTTTTWTSAGGITENCAVKATFTDNYTIGGTLNGLTGSVMLTLAGTSPASTQTRTLTADGSYIFTVPLLPNSNWTVDVATQPTGQICKVTGAGGTGVNLGAKVTNADVTCVTRPPCTATLTVTATVSGGNGTITPASKAVTCDDAGNFTANFTVMPDSGYRVANITGTTCTVSQNGTATAWNSTIVQNCAVTATFTTINSKVSAGYTHSVTATSDGTVWAWGDNLYGQLGNGAKVNSSVAVQVSGLSDITAVSGGEYHTVALVKSDGTVWTWGSNSNGQLGDGTTTDNSVPRPVSGLSDVVSVAAGGYHTIAVKFDGTVWAWGSNSNGQLGDGTTTDNFVPKQISGLSNVVSVAASDYHTVALKSDGTVWAWGRNNKGQLGDGTTTDRAVPKQVSGLNSIVSVAASASNTVAQKSDGTVWDWGYNYFGQLGNNITIDSSVPVQVSGLSGVISVAAGDFHTIALKSDGTVWDWGYNVVGQLGDGTTFLSRVPVPVSSLSGVAVSVAGGGFNTVALKSDGTVWDWGSNYSGQLGNNTTIDSYVPVQVIFSTATPVSVTGVTLNKHSTTLTVGGTDTLTATVAPANATNKTVTWKSDNMAVATVDNNGKVTAIAAGSATITVTTTDGGKTDTCAVTVAAGTFTVTATSSGAGAITPASQTVNSGGTASFTVLPNAGNHVASVIGNTCTVSQSGTTTLWTSNVITQNCAVTATFVANTPSTYTIGGTLSGLTGSVALTLAGTNPTSTQTQAFSANSNFTFTTPLPSGAGWKVSVQTQPTGQTCTVDPTTASGTIGSANVTNVIVTCVTPPPCSATITATTSGGNGAITPASQAVTCGGTVNFTVAPNSGYRVASITGTTCTVSQNGTATAWKSTVTQNCAVTATFTPVYAKVSAGNYHSVAIASDGTVWAWGYNGDGELGNGTTTSSLTPVQVSGLSNVVSVASGDYHSVALEADGSVWTWGKNDNGQLGNGTTTNSSVPKKIIGSNVVFIAADYYHTLAVESNGTVFAWGWNGYGQLGNGTTTSSSVPKQVSGLSDAVSVTAGAYHSVALKSDGTVVAWGDNSNNQLGNGTTTSSLVPVPVTGVNSIVSVAAGAHHTVAIKSDGTVLAWGYNAFGQLGNGTTTNSSVPKQVSGLSGVTAVAAGYHHSIALKSDGSVLDWGINSNGALGNGATTSNSVPVLVSGLSGVAVSVAGGGYHTVALKSDSTVWDWGQNNYGQLGNNTTTDSHVPVQAIFPVAIGFAQTEWHKVAAGARHSVAVKSDGTVWAWGLNTNGQLGNGTTTDSKVPVPVSGLSKVFSVAAGFYHTVALKSDGTVWTWGHNGYGQLGNGTTIDNSVPKQVSGLSEIVVVAAGVYHTVALKSDGTVWAWGHNGSGQLGDGTAINSSVPKQISGLSGIWSVAAGAYYTVAMKQDGTVWTWGGNGNGQLGNGTTTTSTVPKQVSNLSGAMLVACGGYHTLALTSNGTVWAWGNNNEGELGNGQTTQSSVPVQVSIPSYSFGSGIAGGYLHAAGIQNDGSVWTWGWNYHGQLGNGTTTDSHVPVQVSGWSGVAVSVAGGGYHTVAMKQDGTVWDWGLNDSGQLGNNTTTDSYVPVHVSGL